MNNGGDTDIQTAAHPKAWFVLFFLFQYKKKSDFFFFFWEHASATYLLLSEKLVENRKQKTLALALSPNVKIEIIHWKWDFIAQKPRLIL